MPPLPRSSSFRRHGKHEKDYISEPSDYESEGSASDILSEASSDDIPMIGDDSLPGLGSVLELVIATSGKEASSGTQASRNDQSWKSTIVPGRTVISACQAQYTGDGTIYDNHSVELKTQGQTSIYEWIHLEQPHMDFNNFQKQVLDISSLSLVKRQTIASLFKRVPQVPMINWFSKQTLPSRGPQIEPCFIEKTLPNDGYAYNDRTLRQQVVRFWSLPFFYLGNTQTQMPPLLKASYNDATKVSDKEQTVCKVLKDPTSRLYIPQLWCIVVDQSLLITCAQIPHELLRGNLISLINRPPSPLTSEPQIFVSYGQNTVWQIPLAQCKTWFDLLCHFKEFWDNHFRLFCLGRRIKPRDWSHVYTTAQRAGKLTLELMVDRPRKFSFVRYALTSVPSEKGLPEGSSASTDSQRGYILPMLSRQEASEADPSRVLQEYLSQLDSFLRAPTIEKSEKIHKRGLSRAYDACPLEDHETVRLFVAQQVGFSQSGTVKTPAGSGFLGRGLIYERILLYAEFLFKLFLPLDSDAQMVSKFWGAVNRVIEVTVASTASLDDIPDSASDSGWLTTNLLYELETAAQSAVILFDMLEIISADEVDKIRLPSRFSKAWVWLVLFFVTRGDPSLEAASSRCLNSFQSTMEKATSEFMNQSPKSDLIRQSIILPTDIGILLSLQALKDVTPEQPGVVAIYEEYRNRLDKQINTDSSQRSSQITLHYLKEEIRVLLKTAREQESVIHDIYERSKNYGSVEKQAGVNIRATDRIKEKKVIKPHKREAELRIYDGQPVTYGVFDSGTSLVGKIYARDPGGLHHAFADECNRQIAQKLMSLDMLLSSVNALGELNQRKFNANRDRQDLALYAFSTVTVIFLPISTVASILGMNTNDIRNLDANQWLFWAVATPLAFVIVIGGLLWAGELGNTYRGFIARFKSEKGALDRGLHKKPKMIGWDEDLP